MSMYQSHDITLSEDGSFVDKLLSEISTGGMTDKSSDTRSITKTTAFKLLQVKSTLCQQAAAVIVDECMDKLRIIRVVLNERIDPTWCLPVKYRSLQQRFSVDKNKKQDEFQFIAYTDFKKRTKHLCHLLQILETAMDELLYQGRVGCIHEMLNAREREEGDEKALFEEYAANKCKLRDLQLMLKKINTKDKRTINQKLDEIHKMQEKYEEQLAYSSVEWKYLNSFEDNRLYLTKLIHSNAENKLETEIKTLREKIAQENRVHAEIETFLDGYCEEKSEDIQMWMNKYDVDSERLDQEILQAKEQKYRLEVEHKEFQNEYNERVKAMEQWIVDREEIRAAEELLRIQTEAVLMIQAWWRGVMVRKHLGPFSRKKKRKAKAKKQKGKQDKKMKRK